MVVVGGGHYGGGICVGEVSEGCFYGGGQGDGSGVVCDGLDYD